ncbi:hypothetical protein GCM10023155_50470 [Bremerella cremea]
MIILAFLTVAAYSAASPYLPGSVVPSSPVDPGGPNLLAVFQKSDHPDQAAKDAGDFGDLCNAIADGIDWDGQQTEPLLTNGTQLYNLSRVGRYVEREKRSYSDFYQDLGPVIGSYLTEKVGKDGGKIDQAKRAQWVAAYRQLARSAHYASEVLGR